MPGSNEPVRGSCLCGALTYEIEGELDGFLEFAAEMRGLSGEAKRKAVARAVELGAGRADVAERRPPQYGRTIQQSRSRITPSA